MSADLILLVRNADNAIEMLPEVGLSGARLPDDPDGEVVKITPTGDDTAEDLCVVTITERGENHG